MLRVFCRTDDVGPLGAARSGAFSGARAEQLANERTWTMSGEVSAGAFGEDGKGGFCSVGLVLEGLAAHWFCCFKFCFPDLTTGYELDILTTLGSLRKT